MKPVPALQTINLIMGLWMLAWDWPLPWLAGTSVHRSIEARLAVLPLVGLASVMLYQGTNPAIYYIVAMVVYYWAYSEGEVGPLAPLFEIPLEEILMLTRELRSSVPSPGLYPREEPVAPRRRKLMASAINLLRSTTKRPDRAHDLGTPVSFSSSFPSVPPSSNRRRTRENNPNCTRRLLR